MRRPPDAPKISERDVESSNATLSYLGGARRRSWMTDTVVHPSPRAAVARPVFSQVQSPQRSISTPAPAPAPPAPPFFFSPTPSNESSPVAPSSPGTVGGEDNQRAIAVAEDCRDPESTVRGPGQNILWSDDVSKNSPRAEILPQIQPVPVDASHRQTRKPVCQSEPTEVTGSIAEEPIFALSARRPTYPSESLGRAEPVVGISPLPSSVLLPVESRQTSPEITASMSEHSRNQPPVSNFARDTHTRSHEDMTMSPLESPSLIQHGPQRLFPVQGNTEERTTPTNSPSFSPRVSVASSIPEAQSHFNNIGAHPHKRQRTQQATIPSLKPLISLIHAHIASVGGTENLEYGLERPRFQLLERACEYEDSFYVALHQLFCIWDFDPNVVASITGFPDINTLQTAFGYISQLIRDNDSIALDHKKWFTGFPNPLPDLLRTSKSYQSIVGYVGKFLRQLATDSDNMSKECIKRRFPPLVDELVGRLGLLSPILQGVFFRASIRNLKIMDEKFASQMETLFRQDQLSHRSLALRYNTDQPPGNRETRECSEKLKNNYLKIYEQFVKWFELRETEMLPVHPVSASLTPGTQLSQLQPQPHPHPHSEQHQQQQSSSANMGDSRRWYQFSPPQQHEQLSIRRDGNNLGNPPNGAPQWSHHNTQSPIITQGPTMSPHVQRGFQVRRNDTSTLPVQQQQQFHQQNQQYQQQQYQQSSKNAYSPYPAQNGAFQQGNVIPSPILPSMFPEQYQQRVNSQQHIQRQWAQVHHQQSVSQQQGLSQPQALSQHQAYIQHHQHQRMQMEQTQHQQNQQNQATIHQNQASIQILNQGVTALDQSSSRRISGAPAGMLHGVHSRTSSISNGSGLPLTPFVVHGPLQFPPVEGQRPDGQLTLESTTPMQQLMNYPPTKLAVLQRPFVPPVTYQQPNYQLNPIWSAPPSALHQAHVRSPRLVPSDLAKDGSSRYYQVVKKFALEPTKLTTSSGLLQFPLDITTTDLNLRPHEYIPGPGHIPTREFQHGSLQYRLRCIQMMAGESNCSISQWVVQDTVWPDGTCLTINQQYLEIRRKVHHGKDLPIDVTSLVDPDSNCINISLSRHRTNLTEFSYFVAVEVVEILEHTAVMEMCLSNHIPRSVTLESITKSLAGPEDDDECAMAIGDLSIGLADPFTARIFSTPVRGSSCLHRECFDLETFLKTRQSKPKRPEQPCMVDVWKCPLCNQDVRPYSLQVDDFLAGVRKELEERGILNVTAIWIGPDGNWRPKVEEKTGASSDESSDGEVTGPRKQSKVSSKGRKIIEVIDLDDG